MHCLFIEGFYGVHPNHQSRNTKKSINTLAWCFPSLNLHQACLQTASQEKRVIYNMCCGIARLNFRSQQL